MNSYYKVQPLRVNLPIDGVASTPPPTLALPRVNGCFEMFVSTLTGENNQSITELAIIAPVVA